MKEALYIENGFWQSAGTMALRNALTSGNPNAEPSHLLHALLMVPDNTVGALLSAVGADPAAIDAAAQAAIKKLPSSTGSSCSPRSAARRTTPANIWTRRSAAITPRFQPFPAAWSRHCAPNWATPNKFPVFAHLQTTTPFGVRGVFAFRCAAAEG